MSGFEYGNTRLRARHAARLTRADYTRMLESAGLEPMLGTLSNSTYAPDVEVAVARFSGSRRLDEAIRGHLQRQTVEVSTFYDGDIRRRLDLAGLRWDVRNLTALIRAKGAPGASTDILGQLVPAGRLGSAELSQLASQPNLRSLVDLLAVWHLPSPTVARSLRTATSDPGRLEAALFQAFAREVDGFELEDPEDSLIQVMTAEVSTGVLIGALRVREARIRSEPRSGQLELACSKHLSAPLLEEIVATDGRQEVAELLTRTTLPRGFDAAILHWAETGSLPALAEELVAATTRLASRMMRNDPLGIGVPTGYLWTKDQEARNLRLIGSVHIHGLDPLEIEPHMVIV